MRKQILLAALGATLLATAVRGQDDLDKGFAGPPLSARTRAYWWWANGNVNPAAITKDMEWMKSIGMGGALIFDAGVGREWGTPAGPLYGTPAWRKLLKHAAQEAQRLGLEMTLSPQSGWNLGGPYVKPELATKHIAWSELQVTGPGKIAKTLPPPKAADNFYRDSFVVAYRVKDHAAPHAPIRNLVAKAMYNELGGSATDCSPLLADIPGTPGEEDTTTQDVLDLTDKLDAYGTLNWDAPAGTWDILRFGYTNNGARVSTSSGKWQGLVVDYLDPEALKTYWHQVVDPILDEIGPLAGKAIVGVQTDSWEAGGINWTIRFPQEFQTRRGYDLRPWLPVLAGKIVNNRDCSNRFLADFRKTIGDCMAENHYGVMAQLAKQRGMFIHCEASGPHAGPFDGLKDLGHCERPMGECWVYSPHRPTDETRYFMKVAGSAAHVYGKKIACGETFTSIGPHWDDILWNSQKQTFDHEACAGLNQVYWHAFTCSPPEMGFPGQEYFAGTHFDPQLTWAKQAYGFVGYLDRCSFLLQAGMPVADVCYYYGDHVPNIVQRKQADPAKVMPEYDYDVCNEEVLLTRMAVQDGRIVLPDGMSYRALVLPYFKVLSLAALQKVAELVHAGATVVGPKPERTASLMNYPACDTQFKQLADALWDGGKVVADKSTKEVLAGLGVPPDLQATGDAQLDFIHRRAGTTDIYFLSHQGKQAAHAACTFRVAGRQPEIWDAVTGTTRPAAAFQQADGRTTVPLDFPPFGSAFVIFRQPIAAAAKGNATTNYPVAQVVQELAGPWSVTFDAQWGGPAQPVTFEKLQDWTQRPEEGIKYYSGTATYRQTLTLPAATGGRRYLDLGVVHEMAEVHINGKNLGVIWCPPWRVDITAAVKAGENNLQIDVVNLWPNRLLGDAKLPPEQRRTKTNVPFPEKPAKGHPAPHLLASGLLGPVTITTTP